jgi:RNA polymerase sigma factor (sigma-70 family)
MGCVDSNEVADVVRRAAAGDSAAWNTIVDEFSNLLWAVATGFRLGRADAAEVVQTTWVRLVENLDRIKQPEALPGWLATTARREALRMVRMQGREMLVDTEFSFSGERGPEDADPEPSALREDRRRLIWWAVNQLPENCQALLHLLTVVRPTYAEVSDMLGIPIGSIGPTRGRCLKRLREILAELGISGEEG